MEISRPKTQSQSFSRQKTIQTALGVTEHATVLARALLSSAIPNGLCHEQAADLRLVLGLGRQPSINSFASNTATRAQLVPAFIEIVMRTWSHLFERQMQFLTITPGDWHVDEKHPVLRIKAWRDEAWRWFNNLGFTGISILEFAPYLSHPSAGSGRVISPHIHALGYAADETTYLEKVKKFNERFSSRNAIGAFAVNRLVGHTEGDVAMVARYLIDQIRDAKRPSPSRDMPGEYKHRKAALPFHLALRCAEISSYLKVSDLIVVHGGVAKQWRRELIGSLRAAFTDALLTNDDLDRLWTAVWRAKGGRSYDRVVTL